MFNILKKIANQKYAQILPLRLEKNRNIFLLNYRMISSFLKEENQFHLM
jgi:hypothetical protein